MTIGKQSHTTKWIAIKDISIIWANAQRPLDKKWSEEIAKEFDPDMFGIVATASVDGNGAYHCIDGQHRVDAVRTLWGENEKVPCHVFDADSPARAAAIYNTMNTSRKAPKPLEIFKVRVTAEKEPEVSVNNIVTGLGYRIEGGGRDGSLAAVAACTAVFKRHGNENLLGVLLTIRAIWGKTHDSVNAHIIRGFAQFLVRYDKTIDPERLVDCVAKQYTPARLLGAARTRREAELGSLAMNVSRVLISAYNHGLRGKNKIAA